MIFNLPTIFLCKDEGSLIFSPTRSCLKNINSSCKGNHHADRKREAYDPGLTAFKDCIILRSLEGDSSAFALDRSIAQLLTSDGREFARITLESNDDGRVLQLAQ